MSATTSASLSALVFVTDGTLAVVPAPAGGGTMSMCFKEFKENVKGYKAIAGNTETQRGNLLASSTVTQFLPRDRYDMVTLFGGKRRLWYSENTYTNINKHSHE